MTQEQIQQLHEEMQVYVPVCAIEKALNMPATILQKAITGKRSLPKKWVKPLQQYFLQNTSGLPEKQVTKCNTVKEIPVATTRKPYMSEAIKKKLGR